MLAALAIAAAVGAAASEPPPREVVFEPLRAGERSFSRLGPAGPYYPEVAARRGKAGVAILTCRAAADGYLQGCKVTAETPRKLFFGAAARRLAEVKRIRLAEPVEPGAAVVVRVPFQPAP